jgi:hypothetical protein
MDINCSYPFTPIEFKGRVILRPLLQCTLEHQGNSLTTALLLDSGADISMLTQEVARDGLKIDVDKLEPAGDTGGIGGDISVAMVDVGVSFAMGPRYVHRCTIPFQIPLGENKGPCYSLLGRDPFFYEFRVSFRMGYTDDPSVGKFNLHKETVKRSAERFKKPVTFR